MSMLERVEVARVVRAVLDKRRPPMHLREKIDFGFRFHGQSVELFTIRPKWRKPGKAEHPFAKATFVKADQVWKIYWMRANLKWYPYEPKTVRSLKAFMKLVDEDKQGCFFG